MRGISAISARTSGNRTLAGNATTAEATRSCISVLTASSKGFESDAMWTMGSRADGTSEDNDINTGGSPAR
ncbi:MAG: hypothetical protein PVS2B1_25910 [Candidatus Dormibacteraceae bacterium]